MGGYALASAKRVVLRGRPLPLRWGGRAVFAPSTERSEDCPTSATGCNGSAISAVEFTTHAGAASTMSANGTIILSAIVLHKMGDLQTPTAVLESHSLQLLLM